MRRKLTLQRANLFVATRPSLTVCGKQSHWAYRVKPPWSVLMTCTWGQQPAKVLHVTHVGITLVHPGEVIEENHYHSCKAKCQKVSSAPHIHPSQALHQPSREQCCNPHQVLRETLILTDSEHQPVLLAQPCLGHTLLCISMCVCVCSCEPMCVCTYTPMQAC